MEGFTPHKVQGESHFFCSSTPIRCIIHVLGVGAEDLSSLEAVRRQLVEPSHSTHHSPSSMPPVTGAPVHVHGHGMPGRGRHQDPGGQAHGRVGVREAGIP